MSGGLLISLISKPQHIYIERFNLLLFISINIASYVLCDSVFQENGTKL